MKSASPKWQFQSRFRKGAFGWRASNTASERISEAVSEIKKAARADPVHGAEGAIAFIGRVSGALEHVDSSSGYLGASVNWAIEELVPLIAAAPVDDATRRTWMEKLWKALTKDEIPYIERLGDRWGELCATQDIACEWVERLMPPGSMACFSAMLSSRQFERILDTLERDPHGWWPFRRWGFRALVAQGRRAEALRYAEASRNQTRNDDGPIARACESLLLESGMREEAYNRYAIAASAYEPTYLARFRTLAKKYPWKPAGDLLRDLVATTPGREGKWFAAAKSAGLYDEAISLAQNSPCDPKTLSRAARDFKEKRPDFAFEASLAALHWFAEGYGYEITGNDVIEAYNHGLAAAERLDRADDFEARAAATLAAARSAFVRESASAASRERRL